MKKLYFIIISVLIMSCVVDARASQKRIKNISAKSLFESGKKHYDNGEYEQSMAKLSLVAEMMEDADREDADLALKSNKMLWHIYEFIYFDHAKSYEAALRAQELADRFGWKDPEISFSLGSIFQTLSEQADDRTLIKKAQEYFERCVDEAIEKNDSLSTYYMDMAVSNIMLLAHDMGTFRDTRKLLDRYDSKRNGYPNDIYKFNQFFYKVLAFEDSKQYADAIKAIDGQLAEMEKSKDMRRYAAAIYLLKSEIMEEGGYPCQDIIHVLEEMLEITIGSHLKDGELLSNKLLWKKYASGRCADRERALAYKSRYLEIKDSLLSYRQVATMKEIGASRQIMSVRKEVDAFKQRYFMVMVGLAAVVALLVITFFYYWQLRKKNRELSFKNESLYRFAQRDITGSADAIGDNAVEDSAEGEETVVQEPEKKENVSGEPQEDVKTKYHTSGLSEADARMLAQKIEDVFADPAEICNEEFSAQRLGAILGTSYTYVSQVINTKYNCNFNTLLNRSRVREACLIMNEPAQARALTIEGIGRKVGFKSRTTFINSFKKATGMTPSEYLKVAAEKA